MPGECRSNRKKPTPSELARTGWLPGREPAGGLPPTQTASGSRKSVSDAIETSGLSQASGNSKAWRWSLTNDGLVSLGVRPNPSQS